MSKVRVEFSPPRHGWIEVKVSDGSQEVELVVSDVPCDSLSDLVGSLGKLVDGSELEEVEWSLEPEYALWRFKQLDDAIRLEVYPTNNRSNCLVFEEGGLLIVRRIAKGLSDLAVVSEWPQKEVDNRVWSWEFPESFKELNHKVFEGITRR